MIFFFFISSSLLFSSLLSSLLFSSLFSCLVSPLTCLFFFFSFSSSLFSSLVSFSSFLFLFLFLSFVFSFLSLSSFSVCWWCVCRRVCRRVCLCVWCGVVWCGEVCAVWCGTLKTPCRRLKNASVCRFKNVPVYAGNTRTCFSACARVAGIHGDVLNLHTEAFLSPHTGGRRQFCLPKFAHVGLSLDPRGPPKKPLDLTRFQLENRSRTSCSRFLKSFALPDEAVQLQLTWRNVGGNQP